MDVSTGALYTVEEGVAEVLVAPHSSLIGRHVLPGMTTPDDGLVVLGVRRGDHAGPLVRESEETEEAEERFELRAGDAVLVQGPWAALERYAASQDVIAVTPPQSLQRAVPLSRKYKRTLFIFAAMILLLVTGVVPTAIATMLAAGALIVTKVVRLPMVYRAVPWSIVILVGGMIPLSRAFVDTGSADIVADLVLNNLGAASPYLALLVICVISMVLGQFMSNLATVLVMLPIAVAIAGSTGASIQPFMMGLAVCGAASFITPVATAGNLIVMRAGGYHFGDYWKLGLPLMVVYLGIAVLYVPLIWPF